MSFATCHHTGWLVVSLVALDNQKHRKCQFHYNQVSVVETPTTTTHGPIQGLYRLDHSLATVNHDHDCYVVTLNVNMIVHPNPFP